MTRSPNCGYRACFTNLAIAFLVLVTAVAAADDEAGQMRLVAAEGKVEVIPEGGKAWILTQTNQSLFAHWRLRTGPNSRATLVSSDKSVVPLGPGTEIEILPPEEDRGVVLNFLRGVMSFFHRDEPGRIRVITQGARASVDGTEFVMKVSEELGIETVEVSVLDGKVQLSNTAGSLLVTNLQQAVVQTGGRPHYTAVFIANNVLQWALYYPAVLDLDDLPLTTNERLALADSLNAYRTGDLLAALAAYPANPSPASDAERIYYSAMLLSVGQVAEAETTLAKLASGDASDRLQRLAMALRTLIAAVKLEPRPSTIDPQLPTEFLAASYFEQSRPRATGDESLAAALKLARLAANRSSTFGFAHARVAELELSFGRRAQAQNALLWARTFTPRIAQALALEGFVLASENKAREAIKYFDRALAIDPALGNAWLGRGLSRIRIGDKKGGREDLLIAAALGPQRAVLRSYLAKAYADAGSEEKAAHELRLALELDRLDPTAWLYSALINQQHNRINQAISDLERSQELNDNSALFRSQLLLDQDRAVRSANQASVYRDAGMNDVAVQEAAKAITYDYANSSAHLFMSDSFNAQRDPTGFNLRYETVWYNELLLANLLAPVGAARLSQTLGQMENVRLFESEHVGLASSTFGRSDGQVQEMASQYGTLGNTAWAVDLNYQHNDGVRPNNELDSLGINVSVKQQLTPDDSLLFMASYLDYSSGDNFQYYDPANASPSYSFKEEQKPMLAAGYHHQWSPGVHTLLLAGRLANTAHFSAADAVQSEIRDFGPISFLDFSQFQVEYESELEIYSAEINQIVQQERFTLNAGGRWQGGNIQAHDYWVENDTIQSFPIPAAVGNHTESLQRLEGYAYLTFEPIDRVWLTGGVSYDHIEYPKGFQNPPISGGTETRDLWCPKAAIVWNPCQVFTLRGMYSRSLGGFSLDQSFRLEPTQLAGFPQAFRTVISESLVGSVAAPETDVLGVALDFNFKSGTYLNLQLDQIASEVQRTVGIFRTTFPLLPTASTTSEELDYDERAFSAQLNQLLGKRVAIGMHYKFVEAQLVNHLPELSPIPSPSAVEYNLQSHLHRLGAYALYNHPSGIFARFDVNYYHQSNNGYDPAQPADAFVQLNLLLGYRFPQRRAEITFGILNLTDTDYQLSPLTYYSELPRERVFAIGFNFQL